MSKPLANAEEIVDWLCEQFPNRYRDTQLYMLLDNYAGSLDELLETASVTVEVNGKKLEFVLTATEVE